MMTLSPSPGAQLSLTMLIENQRGTNLHAGPSSITTPALDLLGRKNDEDNGYILRYAQRKKQGRVHGMGEKEARSDVERTRSRPGNIGRTYNNRSTSPVHIISSYHNKVWPALGIKPRADIPVREENSEPPTDGKTTEIVTKPPRLLQASIVLEPGVKYRDLDSTFTSTYGSDDRTSGSKTNETSNLSDSRTSKLLGDTRSSGIRSHSNSMPPVLTSGERKLSKITPPQALISPAPSADVRSSAFPSEDNNATAFFPSAASSFVCEQRSSARERGEGSRTSLREREEGSRTSLRERQEEDSRPSLRESEYSRHTTISFAPIGGEREGQEMTFAVNASSLQVPPSPRTREEEGEEASFGDTSNSRQARRPSRVMEEETQFSMPLEMLNRSKSYAEYAALQGNSKGVRSSAVRKELSPRPRDRRGDEEKKLSMASATRSLKLSSSNGPFIFPRSSVPSSLPSASDRKLSGAGVPAETRHSLPHTLFPDTSGKSVPTTHLAPTPTMFSTKDATPASPSAFTNTRSAFWDKGEPTPTAAGAPAYIIPTLLEPLSPTLFQSLQGGNNLTTQEEGTSAEGRVGTLSHNNASNMPADIKNRVRSTDKFVEFVEDEEASPRASVRDGSPGPQVRGGAEEKRESISSTKSSLTMSQKLATGALKETVARGSSRDKSMVIELLENAGDAGETTKSQ